MLIDQYSNFMAALCVWREARNQSPPARLGIWHVIHNRVGRPLFRPSVVRVVLQPQQFSSFNANDPNAVKFPNEANALDWQAWQEILEMVEDQIADLVGLGPDPTQGAVYYETFALAELDDIRAKHPWFSVDRLTATIGAVRFYRA